MPPTRSAWPWLRPRFAIIAVFMPVASCRASPASISKQFGLTVSIAVFMSLLVARLITPLMAAYFLKPMATATAWRNAALPEALPGRSTASRRRSARTTAGRRFPIASIATRRAWRFVLTIALFMRCRSLPARWTTGTSIVQVEDRAPPGRTLQDTSARSTRRSRSCGSPRSGMYDGHRRQWRYPPRPASIWKLVRCGRAGSQAPRSSSAGSRRVCRGARCPHQLRIAMGPGGGGRDSRDHAGGDNPVLLDQTARKVEREMQGDEGAARCAHQRRPGAAGNPDPPEVRHGGPDGRVRFGAEPDDPDRDAGRHRAELAKFSLSDRQVPIRVSLTDESREPTLDMLANLPVPTAGGGPCR
jgi:hypothetical protein